MKQFSFAVVAVLVVVALGGGYAGAALFNQTHLGAAGPGPTHYQQENFLQGLYAGQTGQFKLTNAGVLTDSGAVTFSGASTLSGATTLSGVVTGSNASSTFSGNFVVGGNVTSTTGLILHTANAGLCYKVTLTATGNLATSTAGCL